MLEPGLSSAERHPEMEGKGALNNVLRKLCKAKLRADATFHAWVCERRG